MARKHKHEDHVNHEAWAIPFGDLIILLLAFFVVMYAISSVNEGKYRVAAASMAEAFNGPPKSLAPVQVGEVAAMAKLLTTAPSLSKPQAMGPGGSLLDGGQGAGLNSTTKQVEEMASAVKAAMADLIDKNVIVVRTTPQGIEVEIQTDILFASGTAVLSPQAIHIMQRLAVVLTNFPNPVRVEGHTDNMPIHTTVFPSNWELSAARSASVVYLLMEKGIEPTRLAVIGVGEYRPVADNATEAGRNRNRRVVIVIPSLRTDSKAANDAANASLSTPTIDDVPTPK
ncbi:flagellar motor protein MotD [Paraperlucidibaca sp.]|uniref:flagellar motor protein MotD n=1 Tax=Paraperlucidibaca sp. TaxID=2708021 RepID=UPI0030F3F509